MSDMASVYERHRITLDEYHRMVAAAVFEPDSRVELINGELIEMPPIDPPHAYTVDQLIALFITRLAGRARIRCQNPASLPPDSEPQPDLVVARHVQAEYRDRHPSPDEILLAIEVSRTTLRLDRKIKIPMFARSGIPEVWLLNLIDEEITVYREPIGAWYGSVGNYRGEDTISPLAFPDVAFTVSELLPTT